MREEMRLARMRYRPSTAAHTSPRASRRSTSTGPCSETARRGASIRETPVTSAVRIAGVGRWASTEMVRRYAHLSADHRRLMLNASVRYEPWKKPKAQIRYRPEKGKGSHRCKLLIYWLRGPANEPRCAGFGSSRISGVRAGGATASPNLVLNNWRPPARSGRSP